MEPLRRQGVQAAVFPELCLTGYTLGDLLLQPLVQDRQPGQSHAAHCGTNGRLHGCGNRPAGERAAAACTTAPPCCMADGPIGFVPKTYLPNGNEFYETRWFVSGAEAARNAFLRPARRRSLFRSAAARSAL